jgi:hypothetical protein
MGHKSVKQLYFIEDEMDAVDVYNNGYSELLDKVDGSLTLKPVKPNTEALYNYVLHEWDLCV